MCNQTKEQTLKDFAKVLDLELKALDNIMNSSITRAKNLGIVIVRAVKDKIVFYGAVEQELQLPEFNTKFKIDFDGRVIDDPDAEFSAELVCNRYEFNWACYFKISNIKYEIFNDYGKENKEKWCQGICFYANDLQRTAASGRVMMLSNVDKLVLSNFKIASGAIQIEEGGAHQNFDFLLFDNEGIGVLYKNKLFTIPFEQLADLAVDSGIFGATSYD